MNEKHKEHMHRIKEELKRVTGLDLSVGACSQLMGVTGIDKLFANPALPPHPNPKKRPREVFSPGRINFGGKNLTPYKVSVTKYLNFWLPDFGGNYFCTMPVYIGLLKYCEAKTNKAEQEKLVPKDFRAATFTNTYLSP